MLVEIPYTISSFKRVSEFLNKVVFENIDPSTLVDYNLLYETTKENNIKFKLKYEIYCKIVFDNATCIWQ